MVLPVPTPGLVIGYAYLWYREHREGAEEGRKDRPCAIVVATRTEAGTIQVMVAPITHAAPADPDDAVEIPQKVKRHLGLDDAPSWIVTTELNRFEWPCPDLRPVARGKPDTFEFGTLPVELFDRVKRSIQANARKGSLKSTGRLP
ncbi:MAG TPA: hypothetical protein VEH84_09515 [Alphaproteobacteria bacterium]|nr:hypothetical protein [Alphaproteobacteria bacterium]